MESCYKRGSWAKNVVSITIHKPLSPLYTWVHIIKNENKFYRKKEGLAQDGSQVINNYRENLEFT
ncbi:MAG: hypothetical protein ACRD6U_11810 [Nitrososphaeraceae archaeon]